MNIPIELFRAVQNEIERLAAMHEEITASRRSLEAAGKTAHHVQMEIESKLAQVRGWVKEHVEGDDREALLKVPF